MDEKEALSELREVEQELSRVIVATADRVSDEDVRAGLERVAGEHDRQARGLTEELTAIGQADAEPADAYFREHLEALSRAVAHSRGEDGLFNSLVEAERYDLGVHERLLAEELPARVRGIIEQQTPQEEEHLNFVENLAPGITPTIHGPRAVPKRGPVM